MPTTPQRSMHAEQCLATVRQQLHDLRLAPQLTGIVENLLMAAVEHVDGRHRQVVADLQAQLRQREFTIDQMGELIESLMAN